ncbi:MAG: hypothetical protein K8F24_08900, partial [Bacteroidales bacterium]|nr:hypothetical protein [Bacteroidales bacterium]
ISIQYDFDAKMKEYFNLTVYEFMAAGIVLWLTTNGILYQDVLVEVKALEPIVTEENLLKFVELSSGTPGEYRRLVRGDRWKYANKLLDIYGLDPFIKMPIIKVGYSKTLNNVSYVLPQPFYLLQRTSSGIFYLLATKEKTLGELKGNKAQNNFRNGFGLVYQEYVRMHLRLTKKPAIFIDLDTDFECKKIDKMPDFAVVYGSVCVLFEVKTHLLAVESRTFFDSEKIRDDIKNGNFKKAIEQLHSFRTRILNQDISDARFDGVNRVINIIIGYEDIFVANSVLIKPLYEEYEIWATDLQVGTISDVEVIGSILAEGIDLGQILREKIDDEETRTHSIGVYIENLKIVKKVNPILYDAFNSFMDKMGATSLEN